MLISAFETKTLASRLVPGFLVTRPGTYKTLPVKHGQGLGKEHPGPHFVITNLNRREALEVYKARMRIKESFCDLKSLLSLGRLMNMAREHMEEMVGLVFLAYVVRLLVGERLRDEFLGTRGSASLGISYC